MRANFSGLDLVYEVAFSPMYFELRERGSALLKSIHSSLDSFCSIEATDMQVFAGNSLSEFGVRIAMFNGQARIDISAKSFLVRFDQMLSSAHLELCKACISSLESVLKEEPARPDLGATRINPTVLLNLTDCSASDFLAELMPANSRPVLKSTEHMSVYPGVNIEMESVQERWSAIMNLFRGRGSPSQLVHSFQAIYFEGGPFSGSSRQAEHLEHLVNLFLKDVDLEVVGFYSEH